MASRCVPVLLGAALLLRLACCLEDLVLAPGKLAFWRLGVPPRGALSAAHGPARAALSRALASRTALPRSLCRAQPARSARIPHVYCE